MPLMRKTLLIQSLVCMLLLSACNRSEQQAVTDSADFVLTGAQIYTVDSRQPWAEAVAIKDGRFQYVGDAAGVNKYIGKNTSVANLAGRFVMPGLIDSHTHPGMMGIEQFGPWLPDTGQEDLLAAVKAYAETVPDGEWVRMCCWSNYEYIRGRDGPHKRDLDAVVTDKPVWINSTSWHSFWLNSKALEVLGVDRNTADPKSGIAYFVRDANGEPTGWVKEGAGWQFYEKVFAVDAAKNREGTRRFLEILSEHGVTTVYDGSDKDYEDEVYEFLAELEAEGKLPLRYEGTYAIYVPERRFLAVREMKRLRAAYGGERLRFRTIKLFMDGINSNRSGGMLGPYADDPTYVGTTMLSVEELRDFLLELHAEKFDLHVHAIGDLAARTVLDAVEAAKATVVGDFYPRVSIAHLQIVDPLDWPRFAELGVSANFTPWWHGVSARDPSLFALGEERSSRTYIAKPLFDSGANVTFGSDDWTPEVLSPFLGMQVGHNRQFPVEWLESRGSNAAEYRPPESEQLGLELLIRGYTINGAHPLRMEDEIGSIETGKSADLVVLGENPFTIDRWDIHKIKPEAVIMEGELVRGTMPE